MLKTVLQYYDDTLSPFDTLPNRDGQTDRRADRIPINNYYYYYYKCHGLQCYHHTAAGHFTKSRYKTVAQLNADVC